MGEKIKVLSVISRFREDRLPVISPLCDVVWVSDSYGTGYSRHGKNYKSVNARMSTKKIGFCPSFPSLFGIDIENQGDGLFDSIQIALRDNA